jgi:hypothetical protein
MPLKKYYSCIAETVMLLREVITVFLLELYKSMSMFFGQNTVGLNIKAGVTHSNHYA